MDEQARATLGRLSRTTQPRWPNPTDSIGDFVKSMDGKSYWKAIGPARERFRTLSGEIKTYLDRCGHQIPNPDRVSYSIYMVGRTQHKASQVAMFLCENPRPRREVQNMIKDSGILERYHGIKTGNAPIAPETEQNERLGSASTTHQSISDVVFSQHDLSVRASGDRIFATSYGDGGSST